MSAKIVLPRVLQIGAGASSEVGPILKSLGLNNPLIVTDKVMVLLGYIEGLQKSLVESEISADVFDDTVPEPTVASIQAGVKQVRNGNYDCVIALGGGSPIDSAKAIAILGKYGAKCAIINSLESSTNQAYQLLPFPRPLVPVQK